MKELSKTIKRLVEFRDERDWQQFHNSKDLAIAISIESSELLELFLWKDNEDVKIEKLKEELADIFAYSLLLAEKHGLDINDIVMEKIKINSSKYPISKAKGSAAKYTDL